MPSATCGLFPVSRSRPTCTTGDGTKSSPGENASSVIRLRAAGATTYKRRSRIDQSDVSLRFHASDSGFS